MGFTYMVYFDTIYNVISKYLFKYGKAECTVCKPIRMPKKICDKISKRPRLLPLPEPINIESWGENKDLMKYKSYNELKYKKTHEKYRPSYVHSSKLDSDYFREKKKHDTDLTNLTRQKGF